jgi:hypothetical protein
MTIQLTTAAHCLAMLRSRNAVKDELRKHGVKASHLSAREITSWASVWRDDHAAELIPAAIEQARAMILSGALGKRALAQAQCANLSSPAQAENTHKSGTSIVQISGAKS